VSTLEEIASAAQAVAAALRDLGQDPADAVRLLSALAVELPAEATGGDAIGQALAAAQDATAALCRRAALAALARAAAEAEPPSYDEAVALRDRVCALLEAEELRAADAGEDASAQALRDLRAAVAEDLTARAADLARLRTVATPAPLPALVHAYRLYEDLGRGDELAARADAADPNFLATPFLAPSA
jgi:prophage DNA circulation protein